MRIAQVATMSAPVTRESGGSVEGLVWQLARQFAGLGHDVTTYAVAGSDPAGRLVTTLPGVYATHGSPDDWQLCEWINLARAVEDSSAFDVVHTHAYLWGLPLEPLCRAPMVHSLHIVPDQDAAYLWRQWPEARVAACSKFQWSGFPDLQPASIIPHGVDATAFEFNGQPDDYLLYLGRFISGKGPLHAIEVAREAGLRLVLAGPENAYFREKIRPLIDDRHVSYAGFVQGRARSRLLGAARALLYPIQFPEAFGLVLVEAMLCGTPIAAVHLGAVPEIVEEGVTGCLASRASDLAGVIPACLKLDRSRIREKALQRFTVEAMAQGYLNLYESILRH